MLSLKVGDPLPKHPEYAEQQRARAFWSISDRAPYDYASHVDAAGNPILGKHEHEHDDRYARRLRQAIGRPYVRQIITRYNDHVCRQEAERPTEVAGGYTELMADATGHGMPFVALIRQALRMAQVQRCSYLLADSSDSGIYGTAAEELAAGVRPIIRLIPADSVLWWRDWECDVTEAIILLENKDGSPFLWRVSDKEQQRIAINTNGNVNSSAWTIGVIEKPAPHKYGGCPLIRLCVDPANDGQSQAAPIAESQKRICVLDSLLLDEIQSITFTTTVVMGVSADVVKDVTIGAGHMLCLPNQGGSNPSIGKISADVSQADSIRKSLEYEQRELYRCAGLSAGNPFEPGQPESGVAKAFAFNEIEATLSSIADSGQRAENTLMKRIASAFWAGVYPGDAEWPQDFMTADLTEELTRTIQLDLSNAPPMLKQKAWVEYGKAAFTLEPDELEQLDTEADDVTQSSQLDNKNSQS